MNREQTFLKLLHVLAVMFTTSVLFLWLNASLIRLDWMTRLSPVEELQQSFAQILGALFGLIAGFVSWHRMIKKYPALDERAIALGCLVLLLVVPVAGELFERLSQFF